MGDLMKRLSIPVQIDFMKVSSYGNGTETSGRINIILDLHRSDLSDLDIIIVEDIIDSGKTLSYLVEYLKLNGSVIPKGVIIFSSLEEAEFVDFMMNKYFDPHDEWRDM